MQCVHKMNNKDFVRGDRKNDAIAFTILQEIHENANVTQRKLASEHNVALGSVNIILKRLMNKGHVKITEVHPKRFLYYLTPKGFNEKTRLMLSYISRSIDIYKDVKNHVKKTVEEIIQDGYFSVALCGVDEGFDIVYVLSQEMGLHIAGVYDFAAENIGKKKFEHSVQDANDLKPAGNGKPYAMLITSVAREPILRRRLGKILKNTDRIYSIV